MNIRDLCRGVNELCKDYEIVNNFVKDEKGNLADCNGF